MPAKDSSMIPVPQTIEDVVNTKVIPLGEPKRAKKAPARVTTYIVLTKLPSETA